MIILLVKIMETPSTKSQISNKSQCPKFKTSKSELLQSCWVIINFDVSPGTCQFAG
jgi:hypothetical protein